jgi:hypothetical protein
MIKLYYIILISYIYIYHLPRAKARNSAPVPDGAFEITFLASFSLAFSSDVKKSPWLP